MLKCLFILGVTLCITPNLYAESHHNDAINTKVIDKNIQEYLAYTFNIARSGIASATEQSLQSIHKNAKQKPEQMVKARIIFNQPMDKFKLAELVNTFGFYVDAVRFSVPINARRNYSGEITSFRTYQGTFLEIITAKESRLIDNIKNMATQKSREFGGVLQHVLSFGMEYYYTDISVNYLTLSRIITTSTQIKAAESLTEWSTADYHYDKILNQASKMPLTFGASPKIFKAEGASSPVAATGFPVNLRCGLGVTNENNCPADITWLPETWGYNFWLYTDIVTSWGSAQTEYAFGLESMAHQQRCFTTNLAAYSYPTLPTCSPDFSGIDAPCNDRNVIYVPKAAYESEVVIPDPSCIAYRSGTPVDQLLGCFYHDSWSSTAPGVTYIDTTLSDSNENYNASVGSFNPELFMPNERYITNITFSSYGTASPLGLTYWHKGQLGTSDTLIPCIPGFEEFCVFAVDTTVLNKGKVSEL